MTADTACLLTSMHVPMRLPVRLFAFWVRLLPKLTPHCQHHLQVRHGAVVMVAELLPALAATAASLAASSCPSSPPAVSPASIWPLSPERQAAVCGLVPAIDKARLYRGKGGEVMREAVSRLVECGAEVGLPLAQQQHAKVLEVREPVGCGGMGSGRQILG